MDYSKSPIIVIEEAYKEHYLYLYRILQKLNSNSEIIEDIIQTVFLKLLSNPHSIKDVSNLKAWLLTCAKNQLIDYYRKNKYTTCDEQLIQTSIISEYDIETSTQNKIIIKTTLQKLSLNEKVIIIARDYMGYSYEEIAVLLNTSSSKVKSRLFRARKIFSKFYREVSKYEY